MTDEFPTEFDVIVIGTGLPESILAAAFSRIGQKVLHIDKNGYYSGRWSSFNLHGIEPWIAQTKGDETLSCLDSDAIKSLLTEGESTVTLEITDKGYSHVNVQFHVGDRDEADEKKEKGEDNVTQEVEGRGGTKAEENQKETEQIQSDSGKTNTDESVTKSEGNKNITEQSQSESSETNTNENSNATTDSKEQNSMTESGNDKGNGEEKTGDKCVQDKDKHKPKEKWTQSKMKAKWREFNLDLTPKLLYCGGSMVQLLISSDIAKYCEFKTVTRMLTLLDGKLEKVPCSRADVFNSKEVSMLEKRLLMKFLTSCAEYEKNPADYEAFADKPFVEYLESKKLTKNIKHFVQHSIAMATNQTSTTEGLAKTKKFLHSLGRYGNTAFLWPLYGCGELPQSFCRMCAVFGGVYCLKMSASHLIIDQDKKCTGVISTDGKKLTAKHVIIEESSIPSSLFNEASKRYLSRAVLVTDKSILYDESQQLSMLQIPDNDGHCLTTVLELPSSSMSCPSPLYVVHVTKETSDGVSSPENDVLDTVSTLFKLEGDENDVKPKIMWSLYFKRDYHNDISVDRDTVPENVIVIPSPGPQFDLDIVVEQTKEIFEKLMPGEEFLPRPPNPEDIIYVDDAESSVPSQTNQSDFTDSPNTQSESVSTDQSASKDSDQSETCSEHVTNNSDQSDIGITNTTNNIDQYKTKNDSDNPTESTMEKDKES